MKNHFLFILFFLIFFAFLGAETIHVNVFTGNDGNSGSPENPIRSLSRASELINGQKTLRYTRVVMSQGLHAVSRPALFKSSAPYSEKAPLIIEAEFMPDDPRWDPVKMPVVVSTENLPLEKLGTIVGTTAIKIEMNHVIIRGLRFPGSPIMKNWYYPVFREGKNLKDLTVAQCLFTGYKDTLGMNVGILAHGHSLKVDHCVFYHISNPVVFWNVEKGASTGNAMTHCIVESAYTSAIWVCDTDDDLAFHHNIISNCGTVWMRDETNRNTFSLHDCIIVHNKAYSAQSAEGFKISLTGDDITYREKNIIRKGTVRLVTSEHGIDGGVPRDHLHIKSGTLGSDLGAGLFLKNRK